MSKNLMNILAIGAHPDDIEIGCAGTLLKYAQAGHQVYLLVMTPGGEAGNPDTRRQEQEAAAQLMGAREVFWGGLEDTRIQPCKETISLIEAVIQRIHPDEIYVNYPDDSHQDHRNLAQCVISATRYIKRVLFYQDYTAQNFEPDIFVDIKEVLEDKINVLSCHHSQVSRDYPTELNMVESVRAIAHYWGFHGKVEYAEGFKALRYLKEAR